MDEYERTGVPKATQKLYDTLKMFYYSDAANIPRAQIIEKRLMAETKILEEILLVDKIPPMQPQAEETLQHNYQDCYSLNFNGRDFFEDMEQYIKEKKITSSKELEIILKISLELWVYRKEICCSEQAPTQKALSKTAKRFRNRS